MPTISAFLNSISTLFTLDVYKKWIDPGADDRKLVKVGTYATLFLMLFSVVYSPFIGIIGGGIFNYFQMMASYLAVPIATVFLLGILWKRATPASALTVMIIGIPLGLCIRWLVPHVFSSDTVTAYSLDNFFIISGITQAFCIVIMVAVSLFTAPKPVESISSLIFSGTKQFTDNGPKKPLFQSFTLWFAVFIALYVMLYIILW